MNQLMILASKLEQASKPHQWRTYRLNADLKPCLLVELSKNVNCSVCIVDGWYCVYKGEEPSPGELIGHFDEVEDCADFILI